MSPAALRSSRSSRSVCGPRPTGRRRFAAAMSVLAVAGVFAVAPQQASQAQEKKAAVTLKIASSALGPIIVDDKGLSIYMFTPDRPNVSVCEGQCLVAWPPIMLPKGSTLADVAIGPEMRRSLLGVAMREDGSRQVTYNGWALYYWFRDTKPGDVLGQWVNNIWFVLTAEGAPITTRVPRP